MATQQRGGKFGLRSKLLVFTSLIFILVFSGTTLLLLRRSTATLRNSLQNEAKTFATLATKPIGEAFLTYRNSGTIKITEQAKTFLSLNPNITNVHVIGITGEELFHYQDQHKDLGITSEEASSFKPIYEYNETGLVTRVIYPLFEDSGARRFSLVYDVSTEAVEKEIREQVLLFVSFGIAILILTSLVTYVLIYYFILKPIRSLSKQAVVISEGELSQRISVKSHDEIGDLAEAVARMAASLQKNITNLQEVDAIKTEFMNIVSHNLRTPLTIINGYTDSADLFTKPEQSKAAFEAISRASKRLGRFSEDLLAVSNLELDKGAGEKRPIDIVKLVTEAANETRKQAEERGLHYSFSTADVPGAVVAYAPHIKAALSNLIDNAIKFTAKDGEVVVSLSYDSVKNNIRIDVKDNGIGISDAEQASLFTKFHRGTPTMVYDYEGVGIGLYASKMMIEHQGGNLIFASKEGVGSIFSIILPLKPKELLEHAKDIPWGQYEANRPATPAGPPQPSSGATLS